MGILLRMAWRNLLRNWRRSAIVVSAVAVGLAACLLLIGWMFGMFKQMSDTAVRTQLGHVAVQASGYQANPDPSRNIPDAGARVVEALSPRAHMAPRLTGEGLVQSARRSARVALVGVVPALEREVSTVAASVVQGSYLQETGSQRWRRVPPLVIGAELAERLRVGLGDKVVVRMPGDTGLGAFRIVGIYHTFSSVFDRAFIFCRLEDVQPLLDVGNGVTSVVAVLDDPDGVQAFQAWARQVLAQALPGAELEVLTWREREPRIAAMLSVTEQYRWIFYVFIFVAMAFGIANALLMAIYERTRELGVMRSLGLRARRLVALVLLESLMLTLVGTFLGLGSGAALVLWLGTVGIDLGYFAAALNELGVGVRVYPALSTYDLVFPVGLAAATATVAALWPALKVARLRPAEALRHV